jgi:acetyl esterase/lipase
MHLNVSYGPDVKQKMDVYLPATRKSDSTKSIVIVHGGAWNEGDKSEYTLFVDTLQKRFPGYAIFNLNYRLFDGINNKFPSQEQDLKAGIDFIILKKEDYQIGDKIVLLGVSAGAHLSLLHAYKYNTPVRIKAVVDFFGPADLVDMYRNPRHPLVVSLLQKITGGSPDSRAELYRQSSPVNFIGPLSPPTLILQGGADDLVDPRQSERLAALLKAKGIPSQYVLYPAEGHGWFGPNLSHSFSAIQAFINDHVD